MKSFSFLSYSIIPSCYCTYLLTSDRIFSDIIKDLNDHCDRIIRVNFNLQDPNFKSISFFVSEVKTTDDLFYHDLVGFKVFVDDDVKYQSLFDFKSFPDGSGLPEAVGKALNQFLKENLYG